MSSEATQSLLTEEARGLVGYTSPPEVRGPVTLADIVRYCVAVDDFGCLYADAACTQPLPEDQVEAPADFCQTLRFSDVPMAELADDGLPRLRDGVPRLPVPAQRILYGGARFEFHGRIRVGDTIEMVNVIEDIRERVGRSGPAVFCTVATTCRRGDEVVTVMRTTSVYR